MNYHQTVKRLESYRSEHTVKVNMRRYADMLRYAYIEGSLLVESIVDLISSDYPELSITEIWTRVCPRLVNLRQHGRDIPIQSAITEAESIAKQLLQIGARTNLIDVPATICGRVPVGFIVIDSFDSPTHDEHGNRIEHKTYYILRAISD